MGITDKITGRVKQAAGDLADDPKLRRQGRQEDIETFRLWGIPMHTAFVLVLSRALRSLANA